ncbi:MAG TPA: HlyD family efflux transporter periplasmic adaptor subunit [Burkholderiales bacterium]|nr:HlyD family efflux transporter periplasmic adaptor subunit [Burkholderiales bacterium]
MTKRNRLLLALSGLVVLALVAWALRPKPIDVETGEARRGAFEQTVSDDGKTRVRDRYVVAAPLAGRVERVRLEPGDAVKQGQAVALLTPTAPAFLDARTDRELRERIGAAEAQLARAKAETLKVQAQRDQARADVERQAKLSKEGFVSATALEQAQLALKTAERAADAARFAEDAAGHDYAQARAALTRYKTGDPSSKWEVTSPVNGAVLKVVQKSESPVALGAPLVEIADPRSLEVVVDVLSQEAVSIRPGMPARVELGQGVAPLAARVRLVEPAAFTKISALGVEEQRVNVVLDFAEPLDKVQTIGDAFRVEAHIVVFAEKDALKVPVGALFREGDGWAVFAIDGNRARKRVVRIARRNGQEAMLAGGPAGGLQAGERVVVYPSDALTDGARITAK